MAGRRRTRLVLEHLETRVLLSNDAPFIVAVMPANGSSTASGQPSLSVKFSEAVNAAQAQSTANYLLFASGGRSISIDSAAYDSLNHQVTLSYNGGAALTADQYTLFVRGDQIHDTDDNLPLAQTKQLVVANAGAANVSLVTIPGDSSVQSITNYPSNGGNPKPTAAMVAELHKTGLPDLIVANSGTNDVEIFRGLAAGIFETTPSTTLLLPDGANPQALIVANLANSNGPPDIAVANLGTNNVTVFLNNGQGQFGVGTTYDAGKNPVGLVAGDFSGHGALDLAVVDSGTDSNNHYDVTVLPADPANKGKFTTGVAFDTGLTKPSGIAAGTDLKDNRSRLALADLVVSASSGARVLFNSTAVAGTPNFAQGPILTTTATSAVAVGQISRIGRPDIVATTKTNGGQVLVFQNLGNGFFSSPIPFAANANPSSVALGDFDSDGMLDVIVSNDNNPITDAAPGSVTVLLNRTQGSIAFAAPTSYRVDANPMTVAVHVNSQTKVVDDVVTANVTGNDSSLLRGKGDGTLLVSSDIPLSSGPGSSIVVGDVNGDHVPDIVIGSAAAGPLLSSSTVTVLLSQGSETFAAPVTFNVGTSILSPTPMPLGLALADLTGTGKEDILVTNPTDGTLTILANSGTGSFALLPPIALNTVPGMTFAPTGIAVGDFRHTGHLDVAISHNGAKSGVTFLAGNGDRTFAAPVELAVPALTNAAAIAAADLEHDGSIDLAVVDSKQAGQVVVLHNDGKGNFTLLGTFNAGENPSAIAVGDLNGDGYPDIAVTNQSASLTSGNPGNLYVTVLFNQQGVRFNSTRLPNILSGTFSQPQSIAITDLNRTLFPAIVVSLSGAVDNFVTIQSLQGGQFDRPHFFATSGGGPSVGPSYLAVASDPFIRATTFTVTGTLVSGDLVDNGTFETPDQTGEAGNLVGWQTFEETGSHGQWSVESNPSSPLSGVPVPPAPQGRYAAMLDEADAVIPQANDTSNTQHQDNFGNLYGFNGFFQKPSDYEGMHILYQDVTIPATASQAILSFQLYINNLNSQVGYTDPTQTPSLDYFPSITPRRPNQQVRIDLVDPQGSITDVGSGVFRNLFITTPGTDLDFGAYRTFSFDVSAFKGRTIRLRFASVNNQGKLIVGVDDVHVQTVFTDTVAPGVNNLRLRNPGFGATANFGGNTTDPTILGQVSDVFGINNIASITFDLRNSGTTFSNGQASFQLTDFDAEGNFTTTLPLSLPGIYTVGVTATSRGGATTRSTITFNYQGPSLTAWQAMGPGPIRYDNQGVNYTTVSGHITSIDLDPRDPNGNIIYVGTDNGGVWKTTDGGANWTPLTDYVTDPTTGPVPIAIGGVAVDPHTPDTIYAATGVADNQLSSQPGVGVLKSTDGGKTWTLVGNAVLNGARVSKIAVSRPGRDGLTSIYVAVASGGKFGPGVYRSQDGGVTWVDVLDPTKMFLDTGAALAAGTALASVTDLVIDRLSDFEEDLYIGLGNIGLVPGSDTAGLWKSPNRGDSWFQVVGGHDPKNGLVTWSPLNNNGPTGIDSTKLPSAPGYPNGGGLAIGRVTIAQAQDNVADEGTLYVLMGRPPASQGSFEDRQQKSETDNGLANSFGLYKSKNGGLSWTHVMLRENVPTTNPAKPRNWLNLFTLGFEASSVGALAVDPTDPAVVYMGGSNRYFIPSNVTPNFLEASRAHAFIRVDTRNMRDTDFDATVYYPPGPLPIIPNDGDDITKAGDAVANSVLNGAKDFREPGSYLGMGAVNYEGEGVFWYDLQTTDSGVQNDPGATNALVPQLLLPGVIHSLVFDPLGRLLVGTEGGIYRGVSQGWAYDTTSGGAGAGLVFTDKSKSSISIESDIGVPTPFEPGMTFTDLNGNLQIADMTSVAIDPYSRQMLDASLQSSGWVRSTGSLQWESTDAGGGLGGLADPFADEGPFAGAVRTGPRDPSAPAGATSSVYRVVANLVDVQAQISVSQASGAQGTFQGAIKGIDLGALVAAFPPLTVNPNKLLDVNGQYQDELMYGSDRVYETDNGAAQWDQVSSILTANGDVITALAFGPGSDVFYAGTRNGLVFVDLAGGGNGFPNRSAGLPGARVNGITVDPRDPKTAYVMLGGTGGHVFQTTDGGATWNDVSGNLPNLPAYSMVIDPRALPGAPNGKIYVGTQVGVYVSVDNAATWTRAGNGMPNVPVKDLQISSDFQEVVAGTLGRGAFTLSTQVEGPRVLTVSPNTPTSPGLTSVTLAFDHPVDPRTITPSNVQLAGPSGPVTILAVNDTDPINHMTFQVVFLPQVLDGVYTLTVTPTVQDLVGNKMDQNGNMVNGENPSDAFTGRFVINTSDNGRFVTGLYHDLLSRQADTNGFLGFDNSLESVRFTFLQPTAQGIVTSDEARADTIYNGVITAQHPAATGFYQTLLQRAASPAEIAIWLQDLKQGASPEQVIAAIASSPEFFQVTGSTDISFVTALYTNPSILGRSSAPSLSELNGWLSSLSQTELAVRSGVVSTILHSDEYRVLLINTFFNHYLHRPASAGDVNAWLGLLQRGMTDEAFLSAVVASDEYFNNHGGTNASWLTAIYSDLLNRPLDPGGQTFFLGQLQNGVSRSQVVQILATSTEYRTDLIQADFQKYLGRPASAADVAIYLGALQSGASDEGIIAAIVSSAEYFARQAGTATTLAANDVNWVSSVYQNVLGRPADSGGSATFVQALSQAESGARAGIVQTFVNSVEYRAHLVTVTYATYLMRLPTAQEINLWMPLLTQPSAGPGKPSQDEVFESIVLGSNEYFFRPEQRGPDGLLSNTQYLTSLYNKLLGRAPDGPGLGTHLNTILVGYQAQRQALASSVDTSTEYRSNLVTTLFKTYLRRSPSAAENAGRVAQLAAGTTDEQLISSLVSSPEYFQNPALGASDNSKWLNQAYRDILGRDRDTAGSQGFLNGLNNNTLTRMQVTDALLASDEYHRRLITQLFSTYLGRAPSALETSIYLNAIAARSTDEQLIAAIVASSEYFQRSHSYP
ncbi:MAG TPA: DUF4214 domain-containing protein [Gemmataceae bacterium]|nr:DUF4214 domain-containing protein [Gemmataceae bacterium]